MLIAGSLRGSRQPGDEELLEAVRQRSHGMMSSSSPVSVVPGERIVRLLLLVLFGLSLAVLAAIALYIFQKRPHIDYSATNRLADLTYLETWLAILATGALACLWRRGLVIGFAVFLLLIAEAGAQIYVYVSTGGTYQPEPLPSEQKFEPHPLLVGVPKPGSFAGIVHDSHHRRRTDNPGKAADARVIFTYGGSTTYDLANNDMETWQSDLSRQLGANFSVQNLGVPGYTSVENLIQTLFDFRDLAPACALYFEGFNDVRNSHVRGLKVDYSDFDLPLQRGNLGLNYPGFLANNLLFVRAAIGLFSESEVHVEGTVSGDVDPRVSKIYVENMSLIGEVARHFGVRAVFIPAVANWQQLEGSQALGWIRFVEHKDIKRLLYAIDEDLHRAAENSGAAFVDAPLRQDWTPEDFSDSVHFNAAGAKKFAASIAPAIADLCR
jgi:hypothetical protein